MAVSWTREQKQVIELRDRNLLVSAAAGSGKTAVLVERILSMITDPKKPTDIDHLLVVTFTRAAAAEMKERISAAITDKLEEDPENEHLQKQSVLLHNAPISTIHGFCTNVIRNYIHKTDLDPSYRIADEGELKLLRGEVLQDMLEEEYAAATPEFLDFVEAFAPGKDDKNLEDMILKVYNFAIATPDPDEWMDACVENCTADDESALMEKNWMGELMAESKRMMESIEIMARENLADAQTEGGPDVYESAMLSDLEMILDAEKEEDYHGCRRIFGSGFFERLPRVTKKHDYIDPYILERVKKRREKLKKAWKDLQSRFFFLTAEEIVEQQKAVLPHLKELVRLTKTYGRRYGEEKRERNVIDFSDLEHYALRILLEKTEDGWVRTEEAKEISGRFAEVMTDEYQDSNYLQEFLLEAVSGTKEGRFDRFMVGDMKQSIYAFRMARPDLFMNKYSTYQREDPADENETEGRTEEKKENAPNRITSQKIDLHRNFRSRHEVLDLTNAIFRKLMTEQLGGISYDDAAALYPGADYPQEEGDEYIPELLLLDGSAPELREERSRRTRQEAEAMLAAQRIRELLREGKVLDKKTGQPRPVQYRDIVILLRSEKEQAGNYVHVLQSQGIPAYAPSKTGYFSALEVVTVLNYLRILDNPRQDIPYAAVLRSPMTGCTDTELAILRSEDREKPLYEIVPEYAASGKNDVLRRKLRTFLDIYDKCRKMEKHISMDELIRMILKETGYRTYAAAMPAGLQRAANLDMLIEKAVQFEKSSYQGLFQFVRYIDNLQKYKVDFGEVNIFGEAENTVRIMTIHKSKGLEFPVVFLCGMGNQFNMGEQRERIVQHSTFGIGLKKQDTQYHTTADTLMANVIKNALKRDALGEELRVLYVAMTRAKEKLILTGRIDDPERAEEICRMCGGNKNKKAGEPEPASKIGYGSLVNARCYLDWIIEALDESVPITAKLVTPASMTEKEIKAEEEFSRRLSDIGELWERGVYENEEKIFEPDVRRLMMERSGFTYPYEYLNRLPAKLSVSEIKKAYMEEMMEEKGEELIREEPVVPLIPEFMSGQEKVRVKGARRGTNYHRIFECIDYKRITKDFSADKEDGDNILEDMIDDMVRDGRISREDADTVDRRDIALFLESSIGRRMKEAADGGMLFREQPFVMDVPARELGYESSEDINDDILIQGIIDAYFIENGEIVIVDYKTDHVYRKDGSDLADKYRAQLLYYRKAIEQITGKRVREVVIYSVTLGRVIEL